MPRPGSAASWWRRVLLQWRPLRVVRGHPRLFIAAVVGILTGILLAESHRLATRLLLAWNVGAWLYFVSAGVMIARATPQTLRWRAEAK
jgi:uncharacterized membrane protein